jgi:hypothetical protein
LTLRRQATAERFSGSAVLIADTSAKQKSSLHFSRFMKVQAAFAYGVFSSG